jgi:hypothetical protein
MFSYCAWEYYNWFDASLFRAERNLFGVMIDPTPDALQARSEAISRQALKISLATIWDSPRGVAWFVLSFVFAEAAFVWVALKEYIQDALRLEDTELFLAGRTEKPFDGSV